MPGTATNLRELVCLRSMPSTRVGIRLAAANGGIKMDGLFLATVFAIGILCAVAITVVACLKPETSDTHRALDASESHALTH